ncbi:MAG: PfkB family carbohydrate kinase [Blautia sp.]|nr:PfkB family carbohydrate kinase [Blautia sp.]
MTEKRFDVIGIGDPYQDLLVEVDRLPEHNQKIRMHEWCFQGGGNVPTAMAMAGTLGLKVGVVSIVGDDMLGNTAEADYKFNHVDTSHLIKVKGKRSNFSVCISERANVGKEFICKAGNFPPLGVKDLDEDYIRSARMIHIGEFTEAILTAARWIHEEGGKVSIDAAYYRPDIYENYEHIDIFIGSEDYYRELCKDKGFTPSDYRTAMEYVKAQGPEIVVFTFGPDGCKGVYEDRYFEVPAFKVDVVDSTGAGDVFHGAFVYAYLQGWNPEKSARFCSGASAIKCTRLGGRAGIPTLPVLERFLETGEIDYTEIDERVNFYCAGTY